MTPRDVTVADLTDDREGLPRMSERELMRSKGWNDMERAEPCACGVVLLSTPVEAAKVVAAHVAGPRHQAWRAWRETV